MAFVFFTLYHKKKCVFFFYLFLGLRYTRHQRSAQRVVKSPVEHRSDGPSLQELPFLKAKWEGEGAVREEHVGKLAGRNMRIVMFIYVYWFITISWDNYNYHHIITISWDLDVISITRSPKILAVFLAFGVFNRIPWPADGAPVRRSNLGALTEFSTDGGSMKLDQREKHLQPKCTGILWFCRPWSPSGRSFCVTEWVFGPVLCQPGIDVSGPDIESRTCKTWMFLAKVRIQTAFGDNVFGPWSRCTKSLNSLCMEKGWNNQWSTGERCKKGQKIETKSERHGKSKPISPTGGNIETKTSAKSLILLSRFPVSSKLINYNFEKVNN